MPRKKKETKETKESLKGTIKEIEDTFKEKGLSLDGTKLNKRGRKAGEIPDEVILYNRHNCLFYKTIKDKDGKVIGRDYSVHDKKVESLQIAFSRAKDTMTTKLMKAVRDKKYKEDIFKAVPLFFDIERTIDIMFYPAGLFDKGDEMISVVVDKEKAMIRLDELIKETKEYLTSLELGDLAQQLQAKFDTMETEDTPIGRTEKQNPDKVQVQQLKMFKF